MDLTKEIARANEEYFHTGTSDYTDEEYDALVAEAKRQGLEPPSKPSPSTDDGLWVTMEHARPMVGITEAFRTGSDYKDYAQSHQEFDQIGWYSLKYDGLALELQYDGGSLRYAVLRGDSFEGENVIPNAERAGGVPDQISFKGPVAVYGELVISFNNLKTLNEIRQGDGLEPYKTPRNAVALVRARTSGRMRASLMPLFKFRPYDTYPSLGDDQALALKALEGLSLQCHPTRRFDIIQVAHGTSAASWASRNAAHANRQEWKYLLDGVVFRSKSGHVMKLKFPAESAVTTVIDVDEQLSRTGIVAPVCRFEPLNLGGVTVKQASAHNHVLIQEKLTGLGPGARVLVSRRGDVIPHLERVVQPSEEPWVPVEECPSCGAEVIEDGSFRRCSADQLECSGTGMGLIMKFCKALGIDGFGPGVVAALYDSELVTLPVSLYLMEADDIAQAVQPGGSVIGDTIARRLVKNVHKREVVGWGELLGAIGVPNCAASVMQAVADDLPDPDALRQATHADLVAIPGVGSGRAKRILYFIELRWDDVIQPLLEVVSLARATGPLSGQAFCITLGLKSGSRGQVEARIRSAGGKVKGSVTKTVTHVVCNSPDEKTTKLKRARELGLPIIGEDELFDMMGLDVESEEPAINPEDEF